MGDRDYWQKQEEKPLFNDIEWQKPQNKKQAGKLLIVGGNTHGFELPAKAFQVAGGAGEVMILLPSKLEKLMPPGADMPIVYAPSTDTGSFAKPDEAAVDKYLEWADMTLVAGDLGNNSQTSLFMEYLLKSGMPLTLTKDSLTYLAQMPELALDRENTVIAASFANLQKTLQGLPSTVAITSKMGVVELIDQLAKITSDFPSSIITSWQRSIVVASGGQVTTTKDNGLLIWQIEVATRAAVLAMQNPNQTLQALTHAVYEAVNRN